MVFFTKNKQRKIVHTSLIFALAIGTLTLGWTPVEPVFAVLPTTPTTTIGLSASIFNNQNHIIDNGSYQIRFALYSTNRETIDIYPSNTDTRLWEETQTVTIKSGLIKAFLGSVNPFPSNLNFQTGDYYVGIRIGTDSEMIPRKKLSSVPSAINTQYLQGKTIGNNKGDIPLIASTGTLDTAILKRINQVGTIANGTWQGSTIADAYIADALTSKTYNGINLLTTTGNHTLTLSSDVTIDQNLSLTSDVVFNTLSLTTALSPQSGGTGITSYQTGDMLYATSETTLNTFPLGANNQLLAIVNGVPTWKTVHLADELLGILPFLNGGTGNTDFTLGSVIFSDGAKLTQDNANFFWDATTHRLGIGTTTPSQKLDIVGNANISGTLFSDTLTLTTPLTTGSGGTGLSTAPSIGQLLIGNGTNYTLATLTQGTGITISNGSGVVTITNAGVTSLAGTTDQIAVTANTGSIMLSLPQNIATTSTPTFASINTGQGSYELYAMNQDVLSTSTPTFASLTLTNPLTTGNGGTGITSYTAGDLLYYASGTTFSKLNIGTPGQVLVISGSNIPTWVSSATATAHNLLSSSHDDTTVASAQRGDLITGQGTTPPLWNRLALGTTGQVLISNGSDAYWGAVSGQTGIIQANSIDFSELKDAMTLDNNLTIDATLNNYSVNIDNNTFFIDTANNRIGIGTALPATSLDLGSGVITTTGGTSTNWNTAYTSRADTWSYPLSLSGNTASLGYNATNLLLTTNQLNTIQDIASSSSPTFATMSTGQGAYELYAMNQDVMTTSDPTFHTLALTLALPVGSGGTGIASYTTGDLLYYVSGTTLTKLPIGTGGQSLIVSGGIPAWTSSPPVTSHNLLSLSHTDTTANAVQRGDLITGQGVSPTWNRLGIGTNGLFLKSNGTDIAWVQPTKSDVGLSSVEDTALSTWSGSTNITTLGTIATGTWNATTIGVAKGGTGVTTFTTNYLVKGSGASALASSIVYDDGTNVGIGTTVPQGLLSIAGGDVYIDASDQNAGTLSNGSVGPGLRFGGVSTGEGIASKRTATGNQYGLDFYTSYLNRMAIAFNGNVGIGTTNPGYPLDVVGTIASRNYAAQGVLRMVRGDGTSASPTAVVNADLIGQLASVGYYDTSNTTTGADILTYAEGDWLSTTIHPTSMRFRVSPASGGIAEAMRISNTGNVGIGTTSPITKLSNGATINTGAVSTSGINWQISEASKYATSFKNAAGYGVHIEALAGSNGLIVESGNVGIGTTAPANALDVAGIVRISSAVGVANNFNIYSNGQTTGQVTLAQGFGTATDNIGYLYNRSNADFVFGTNNTEKMRIQAGGNVGIGTTGPGSLLSVGAASTGFNVNSSGHIGIGVVEAAGNIINIQGTATASGASATGIVMGNGLNLTASANNDVLAGIRINPTYTVGAFTGVTKFGMYSNTTENNYFAGNVGIGTTGPGTPLDIKKAKGGSGAESIDLVTLGLTGTAAIDDSINIRFVHPNGSPTLAMISGISGPDNSVYGSLAFSTRSYLTDTVVEAMRINNRGNVGIGTTGPGHKLEVGNGGSGTADVFINDTNATLSFGETSTFLGRASAVNYHITGSAVGDFAIRSTPGRNLLLGTGSTLGLAINNGNVGIGTTTPGYQLDIASASGISATQMNLKSGNATNVAGYGGFLLSSSNTSATRLSASFLLYSDPVAANRRLQIYAYDALAAAYANVVFPYGNVGIGTTNPLYKLDVNGTINATNQISVTISNGFSGIYVTSNGSGITSLSSAATGRAIQATASSASGVNYALYAATNSTSGYDIYAGGVGLNYFKGNVGIGTTDPGTYKLNVAGTGYLGAAAWVYSSDQRLKENISYLGNNTTSSLDKILQLKPAKFDYITGDKNNIGFIAQDVQQVIPEAVLVTNQMTGMLGLKTDFIIPYLVGAMQELNQNVITKNTQNDTIIASLSLKTDTNITTLAQLQTSVDTQLTVIGTELTNHESRITHQASLISEQGARLTTLETLAGTLQTDANTQASKITTLEDQMTALMTFYTDASLGNIITKDALGNVDLGTGMLKAGEINSGTMIITKFFIENKDRGSEVIGDATIPLGETKIVIPTKGVAKGSHVLVTPRVAIGESLAVTTIKDGESFTVEVLTPTTSDLPFQWWIVEEK